MAVAHDVETEKEKGAVDTTTPQTFTHTPSGTPKGVVLLIAHGDTSNDIVTSASYGGVSMTRVITVADTAVEPGRVYAYFLGSSIPTGAQTVSVSISTTNIQMHFVCNTITAATDTEVIDSDSTGEDQANPTLTMNKSGRTAISYAINYSGTSAPGAGTLQSDNTRGAAMDMGSYISEVLRETTVDSSDQAMGWSTLASDDTAFVALAVSEVTGAAATVAAGFIPVIS